MFPISFHVLSSATIYVRLTFRLKKKKEEETTFHHANQPNSYLYTIINRM